MLNDIQPTSKTSLKMTCLRIAQGNLKEATALYDFLAADITLPDFDPVKPTFLEQTRDTANGILGWLKENRDTLAEGYDFIKGILSRQTPNEPLPPIN